MALRSVAPDVLQPPSFIHRCEALLDVLNHTARARQVVYALHHFGRNAVVSGARVEVSVGQCQLVCLERRLDVAKVGPFCCCRDRA
eukprot:8254743-Pyramimonas_sp.AAC.1